MTELETLPTATAVDDSVENALGQWDIAADSPVRRQAALVILGRSANQVTEVGGFLDSAASMAARTLGLNSFGVARFGSVDETLAFRFCAAADDGDDPSTHLLTNFPKQSAAAFALHNNGPIVFANLAEEKRFDDPLLKRHRVQAGIVCSLGNSGSQPIGTIGVFSSEPRNFAQQDAMFVESVAQLMGSALARHRAETALGEQTKVHSATMDSMDSLVIGLTPQGAILHFNQACQNVTGFSLAEVRNRPMWNAFLVPEEVNIVKSAIDRLRGGTDIEKVESFLLTKHGVRRRIGWSFTALRDADDRIQSLIGTGIDLTGQFDAVESLQRAESDAEHARRLLTDLKTQIESGDLAVIGKNETLMKELGVAQDVKQDRRKDHRRAYPYVQILAPMPHNRLPGLGEFYEVRCRDISLRGFSFYHPEAPLTEKYVVAFGAHPDQIYLISKVVHVSPTMLNDQEMFLIGCRYIARAEYL